MAVGLMGVLASCTEPGSVVVEGYYGNVNQPSTNLTLGQLTKFSTNWRLSADVRDAATGQTIKADTYVICDNNTTTVSVNANWTGYLSTLGVQMRGYNTNAYSNIRANDVNAYSGTKTITFNIGTGLAPLSVTGQSIVVTPINNVVVKGYTYLRAQGLDGNGYKSNIVTTDYSIPVMDCR